MTHVKPPYGGGGGGGKPVLYKPVAGCPWETNHGYATYGGDCPGFSGKCNLKYFKGQVKRSKKKNLIIA